MLPAPPPPDNFFCEAGRLFRLGLEVAFFALQGTDGHIVSGRATISTRHTSNHAGSPEFGIPTRNEPGKMGRG